MIVIVCSGAKPGPFDIDLTEVREQLESLAENLQVAIVNVGENLRTLFNSAEKELADLFIRLNDLDDELTQPMTKHKIVRCIPMKTTLLPRYIVKRARSNCR